MVVERDYGKGREDNNDWGRYLSLIYLKKMEYRGGRKVNNGRNWRLNYEGNVKRYGKMDSYEDDDGDGYGRRGGIWIN